MSLSGLLNIARSALAASQRRLDVAGHNIANASTEGYTRQRVRLSASSVGLPSGLGQIGLGVEFDGIERVRSTLLDAAYRREAAALGQQTVLRDTLRHVDAVLGDLSGGLASTLDAFWSAWSGLAVSPNDRVSRLAVQTRGQQVVAQIHGAHDRLAETSKFSQTDLRRTLDEINRDLTRLAQLNTQVASMGGGLESPSLLDERDRVIDRLASMLPVTVLERKSGTVALLAGDAQLVDGGMAVQLALQANPGGGYALVDAASGRSVDPRNGRMQGLMELVNNTIPNLLAQLDDLTRSVVTEVNALHRTGLTVAGQPNLDFFDPFGVSAGSIALTPGVEVSADNIAAGTSGAPGDGALAQAISDLQHTPQSALGNRTPGTYYVDLLTAVGMAAANATQMAASHEVLASQAQSSRASVSGVSMDEELVGIISHQQAYSAAARLVTVADAMVQDLLRMV